MLVLTRKIGESIQIGENIRITVVDVEGGCVKLGIDAPRSVSVHRDEIYRRILDENQSAVTASAVGMGALADMLRRRQS